MIGRGKERSARDMRVELQIALGPMGKQYCMQISKSFVLAHRYSVRITLFLPQ